MNKLMALVHKTNLKVLAIFIITFLCVFSLLYLTIFRSIDSGHCSKRIIHNIGYGETGIGNDPYEVIRIYTQNSLKKGMNPKEIFVALEKIGPFKFSSETLVDGKIEETVIFRVCYQAQNNPIIYIIFTPTGNYLDTIFPSS